VPNIPTVRTLKPTPITTNKFTTLTALLACILRVNLLDFNTLLLSFIYDELLKFGVTVSHKLASLNTGVDS
jgi:hypothetical protein